MLPALARPTASWRGTLAATSPPSAGSAPGVYRRHRPETTALYEVVRDNLETLFGAIDDGALAVRLPRHARKELLAYLVCGLLCRGSSAVSGESPPAGPQWSSGLRPLRVRALAYDKPLCASLDGFTLHAATRAGGLDAEGREALLRYVLRGPRPGCALRRLRKSEWSSNPTVSWPGCALRITLKKAYADGTVAVDMDPLWPKARLRARSCAGSQPACLHHGSIRSTMRGCSRQRVHGARASARSLPSGDATFAPGRGERRAREKGA